MHKLNQLCLEAVKLAAGEEWMDAPGAWRFLRLHSGAAYWLGSGNNRPLAEGEIIVAPPRAEGVVRASQIGDVVVHGFRFSPDLLCGFFTLAERDFLEVRSRDASVAVQFLPSTHAVAQQFAASASGVVEGSSLSARVMALGLVAAVFGEELALHRAPQAGGSNAQERFEKMIVRMPETELMNHTPEELARLCGCSPRHFNRLFRQQFGVAARARQTELRLLKARQMLTASDDKIIDIAVASGYRNLSLFNSLFKKHFGLTPSKWRKDSMKKTSGKPRRTGMLALLAGLLFAATTLRAEPTFAPLPPDETVTIAPTVPATNTAAVNTATTNVAPAAASTNDAPVAATPKPLTFRINSYELEGNTLLTPDVTDPIFSRYTGDAVTFDVIRLALADLQLAYRHRGFMTVAVSLPQQQLTNGVVRVKVTEGRLVDVVVKGNKHFRTENILRALPSARTNSLLNSLVFQQELDRANANNDRQVYPVVAPGPEPGTSVLELRVKDRLPFHMHMELNNFYTPGTPDLRMNLSGVYNNLWQRDHQIGVSYSMTPEDLKSRDGVLADGRDNPPTVAPYDRPEVSSYSMFYRMPLGPLNGYPREYTSTDFGWNEATHRFRPPPLTGSAELIVYASRSYSDTGSQVIGSTNLATPSPSGGLLVTQTTYNRNLNPNENLGFRISKPLPPIGPVNSTVSAGFDYKNYRSTVYQSILYNASVIVPGQGFTNIYDPPGNAITIPAQAPNPDFRKIFTSVEYLPLTVDWSGSVADKFGSTAFDVSQSYNPGLIGQKSDFQAVANSTNIDGKYYVVTASVTRDQKFWHDYGVILHADGQWANQALIGNEQQAQGGNAGPRGFPEGAFNSDGGWRVSFEPHTPWIDIGPVDGDMPMLVRFALFTDYADAFNYQRNSPAGGYKGEAWTTGFTVGSAIGSTFDFRLVFGWVLPGLRPAAASSELPAFATPGTMHISFSLNAQY